MATKKAHKPAKKRKTATIAPKEEEGAAANLGSVSVPAQATITLSGSGSFDEMVIEWGCLGLSEEPDKITETSGNNRLLDPKRPITTSEEGVHVYFDPPLTGAGIYGFRFECSYNEAAEARAAVPKSADEHDEDAET